LITAVVGEYITGDGAFFTDSKTIGGCNRRRTTLENSEYNGCLLRAAMLVANLVDKRVGAN